MDIRNVIAVGALVAAGLAVQGLILAEIVARPLAAAVAASRRGDDGRGPGAGAADGRAPANEIEPSTLPADGASAGPDGTAASGEGSPEASAAADGSRSSARQP